MTPTNKFRWAVKKHRHTYTMVTPYNDAATVEPKATLQQWWRFGGEDDFPRSDEGEWRDVPVEYEV
jgi:hypothetical protein